MVHSFRILLCNGQHIRRHRRGDKNPRRPLFAGSEQFGSLAFSLGRVLRKEIREDLESEFFKIPAKGTSFAKTFRFLELTVFFFETAAVADGV